MKKLGKIGELACEFDNMLHPLLGDAYDGGCLILGRHYAQSNAMFLGRRWIWGGCVRTIRCVPTTWPANANEARFLQGRLVMGAC
ncbi:MAG: hypothetical protein WA324_14800 [Bryobacteraceae bacterium]